MKGLLKDNRKAVNGYQIITAEAPIWLWGPSNITRGPSLLYVFVSQKRDEIWTQGRQEAAHKEMFPVQRLILLLNGLGLEYFGPSGPDTVRLLLICGSGNRFSLLSRVPGSL